MTATPLPLQPPPGGPCPHIHTTGMHCPDPAGHELPHALPHGCTECNVEAPFPNEAGHRGFLRDLFDAHGAPLPDERILTALAEALGAAYGWGWLDGHDEGWGQAINTPPPPEDNPQ